MTEKPYEGLEEIVRLFAALIVIVLCSALSSNVLAAEPNLKPKAVQLVVPAPFGLEWGLSKEEIEAKGIKLEEATHKEGGKRFSATGLSKLISGVEVVLVDFGFDNKLWKVIAISVDYPNDPYGFAVMGRYTELNDILAEKYGKGKSVHRTDDSFYNQAQYFLAGLKMGNSWHYTTYGAAGVNIELSIRAKDTNTGYWVLIYNNAELAKGVEKTKASREKGAL